MLRFRLDLTAVASAVTVASRRGAGASLRQPLGLTVLAVPCWVSSISLDRFRPRIEPCERLTVRRLLPPAATRRAVAPAER